MAVLIDEPTLVDTLLHYGLFAGAIFQFICIFAVVLIPKSSDEEAEDNVSSQAGAASQIQGRGTSDNARKWKREKKKHR